MTPESRKEHDRAVKAQKAAAAAALAEKEADPYGGLSPLTIERGEALTFNVENGAPAPRVPRAPPLMPLFDWRWEQSHRLVLQCSRGFSAARDSARPSCITRAFAFGCLPLCRTAKDAALLLGGDHLAQNNYEAGNDEDHIKWGWLECGPPRRVKGPGEPGYEDEEGWVQGQSSAAVAQSAAPRSRRGSKGAPELEKEGDEATAAEGGEEGAKKAKKKKGKPEGPKLPAPPVVLPVPHQARPHCGTLICAFAATPSLLTLTPFPCSPRGSCCARR